MVRGVALWTKRQAGSLSYIAPGVVGVGYAGRADIRGRMVEGRQRNQHEHDEREGGSRRSGGHRCLKCEAISYILQLLPKIYIVYGHNLR
jgi:hypothetical protein